MECRRIPRFGSFLLISILSVTGCGNSSSLGTDYAPGNGAAGSAAGSGPSAGGASGAGIGGAGVYTGTSGVGASGAGGNTGTSGTGTAGTEPVVMVDSGVVDGGPTTIVPPAAGAGGAGTAGNAGTAGTAPVAGSGGATTPGQTLPPVTDYAAAGPFAAQVINNTGHDGQYTMFRPTALGENGFLHPPLTWGNGITTTPAIYTDFLTTIATHGFVIIASNSTSVSSAMMTAGLDWLLQLNDDPSSEFYQKLDPNRAVSMGYSLGGGGALSVSSHPAVATTIAMHPAPGMGARPHGPVLLFTGSADTVCVPSMVESAYASISGVPAFLTNLAGAAHTEPVLTGGRERGPSIAWLRMWIYGDDGARDFFYGASCTLCVTPWTCQTKNM
jgi:hypothetical protein